MNCLSKCRVSSYQQKAGLARQVPQEATAAPHKVRKQDLEEDTMAYVLIIVSWLGGAVNGAAISTQEFTSAERCEVARMALIEDAKARNFDDTLKPLCMQK